MFFFPSHFEGFGWPPLEAQACGCPVVCSKEGSLAEIVEDSALTAQPDDEDALATHIDALCTIPRCAKTPSSAACKTPRVSPTPAPWMAYLEAYATATRAPPPDFAIETHERHPPHPRTTPLLPLVWPERSAQLRPSLARAADGARAGGLGRASRSSRSSIRGRRSIRAICISRCSRRM